MYFLDDFSIRSNSAAHLMRAVARHTIEFERDISQEELIERLRERGFAYDEDLIW